MIWLIYPPFLILALLSVTAVAWYASSRYRSAHIEKVQASFRAYNAILADALRDKFSKAFAQEVDDYCKRIGSATSSRVTVVLADGAVIGDSAEDPALLESHFEREEIAQARAEGVGSAIRYSSTIDETLLYVAMAVTDDSGNLLGVVRTSVSLEALDTETSRIKTNIMLASVVFALLLALLSVFLARRIRSPLLELRDGALRFSRGDLTFRIPEDGFAETASVAAAMNDMAWRLRENIRHLTEQRAESETILSSMVEGVLAFDEDERLIKLNASASSLLGISWESAMGRSVQEVIRNTELQRFISLTLRSPEAVHADILVAGPPEKHLKAGGTAIRSDEGRVLGCVVVLDDVSELKRLENVRKEFVANVSHELKTPVTSIMGFCESLQDGAVEDPELARKFVDIISKQTDRLASIIDDLLSLSRIERVGEKGGISMQALPLGPMLQSAIETVELKAQNRNISIERKDEDGIIVAMNDHLMEQAVVNLLDNAIKYSDDGTFIEIEAWQEDDSVFVSVVDQGLGIAPEHLPRIFERFYTVDKARSRKLGGTGLGLSIVKHIALLHNGTVTVESEPGIGSRFTIRFPVGDISEGQSEAESNRFETVGADGEPA